MDVLRALYAADALRLVAVDEAHCISSWGALLHPAASTAHMFHGDGKDHKPCCLLRLLGTAAGRWRRLCSSAGHDFRSSYRKLWLVRQELPRCPIMALTATASPRVQADITQQLRLRQPVVLRSSFNRPNIEIRLRYLDLSCSRGGGGGGSGIVGAASPANPLPALAQLLQERQLASLEGGSSSGATIIYCHKRDMADRVAAVLSRQGLPCRAYHAGLPDAVRRSVLSDWQQQRLHVVAATVAFGLGIDRPGAVRPSALAFAIAWAAALHHGCCKHVPTSLKKPLNTTLSSSACGRCEAGGPCQPAQVD